MRNKQRCFQILHTAGQFLSTTIIAFIALLAIFFVGVRMAGIEMFSIESNSMSPAFPKDTLVFVRKVDPQTIEIGDVITYVFNADGVLVTHRVIDIEQEQEQFYTKGDANNSKDPNPVLWGNMIGKVVLGIPKLGAPIRYLTAKENRVKIIIALFVIGIISILRDILERIFKKRKIHLTREKDTAQSAATDAENPAKDPFSKAEKAYKISDRKKEDILYKY